MAVVSKNKPLMSGTSFSPIFKTKNQADPMKWVAQGIFDTTELFIPMS